MQNISTKTRNKALFITFEGGEGCGKTTQSKKLYNILIDKGFQTIWTREIGGTQKAELIRDIMVTQELNVRTELLLAMAARSEHIDNLIKPALSNKKIVICDRFVDSTAAYQGSGIGYDIVYKLHQEIFGDFMPDLTFFLDIDPEKALLRAKSRGDSNKFEHMPLQFHKQIYQSFLKIAEDFPDRVITIDATKEESVIFEQIYSAIKTKLEFS